MADVKHTPGPWTLPHFAEPEHGCECGYVLTDGYVGAVCTVHCSGTGPRMDTGDNPGFDEAVANARLIAAAPEMLSALRQVRASTEWSCMETPAQDAVEAAISKAMGQ